MRQGGAGKRSHMRGSGVQTSATERKDKVEGKTRPKDFSVSSPMDTATDTVCVFVVQNST